MQKPCVPVKDSLFYRKRISSKHCKDFHHTKVLVSLRELLCHCSGKALWRPLYPDQLWPELFQTLTLSTLSVALMILRSGEERSGWGRRLKKDRRRSLEQAVGKDLGAKKKELKGKKDTFAVKEENGGKGSGIVFANGCCYCYWVFYVFSCAPCHAFVFFAAYAVVSSLLFIFLVSKSLLPSWSGLR